MPFILVMCNQYRTYFVSISSHQSLPTFHCRFSLPPLPLLNSMDFPQIITVVFLQYSHYTSQLL